MTRAARSIARIRAPRLTASARSAPAIRIRRYRSADARACARLHRRAMATRPWNERWPSRRALQKVRSMAAYRAGFVAVADGTIVGHLWATTYIGPTGTILFITNLQVDPAFHGNGAGTQLIMAAERLARAKRIRTLELLTSDRVPAHRFYRSRGFTVSPYNIALRKKL